MELLICGWLVRMVPMCSKILFIAGWFCGASILVQAQDPAPVPAVMEATAAEADEGLVGKVALVRGTVDKIDTMKTGHRKVFFKGSKFFLFITAKDFAAHADWNLDAWVGKELYAIGLVKLYYSQKEMVVTAPSQIGASAEGLKLGANVAAAGDPSAPDGADLAIKSNKAALTQLRLQISGAKTARAAKLMSENLSVSWEAQSSRSTTNKQLRFEGSSYSTKGREPSDAAVTLIMARHGGDWPTGKVAQVTRPQSPDGAGWPTTLAMAVLLESTLSAWELPAGLRVLGDLNAAGAIEGGQNELYHLLQQNLPADVIVLVPAASLATMTDQALQLGRPNSANVKFFGVQSLDEVGTVLEGLAHKTWEPQLAALTNLQLALAAKGPTALRSAEARAVLADLARFCPLLLNGKLLQAAAEGKGGGLYSLNGAAQRLFALHTAYENESTLLQTGSPEARKKAKEFKDTLMALKPAIPAKYKLVVEKLETLLDALQDAVRCDPKDDSARAKKARSQLESANAAATAEVFTLEGEVGLGRSGN